jgi:hypothetical protein
MFRNGLILKADTSRISPLPQYALQQLPAPVIDGPASAQWQLMQQKAFEEDEQAATGSGELVYICAGAEYYHSCRFQITTRMSCISHSLCFICHLVFLLHHFVVDDKHQLPGEHETNWTATNFGE